MLCGSEINQLHSVINRLEKDVNRVAEISSALLENPVVDKEIDNAKTALLKLQNELHEARSLRLSFQQMENKAKYSVGRVYFLMGKIDAFLANFSGASNLNITGNLKSIESDLNKLELYFRSSDRKKRELSVDKEIGSLIEKYAEYFDLEQRGNVSLDKNELTLSFQQEVGFKKEYLWEVGSGTNWMGYHIATFLALHQYLSKDDMLSSPVFSFLITDQPSQVFFPGSASGINQLDGDVDDMEKLTTERDVDVRATKRIFEVLELGLRAAKFKYQIIVLEHADNSIWGGLDNVVEIESWKGANDGLIPYAWL